MKDTTPQAEYIDLLPFYRTIFLLSMNSCLFTPYPPVKSKYASDKN